MAFKGPILSAPLPWLAVLFGSIRSLFRRGGAKDTERPSPTGRKNRFKLPRSIKFTSDGRWYVGLLILIGIAAINTGNNLLYLVVAMMLSLIIISGLLSESTLRGLTATRLPLQRVQKGRPVTVRYKVKNEKKIFPSYSFTISESLSDGGPAEKEYILKINNLSEIVKTNTYLFKRRGRVELTGISFLSTFPFGLFIKGKEVTEPGSVIVLPRILDPGDIKTLSPIGTGREETGKRGTGTELHSIRRYIEGDDSRFIHWKSTARLGRLHLKEFEEERDEVVEIIFENLSPRYEEGREYNYNDPAFEGRIDEAASLAYHLERAGVAVGLTTLTERIGPNRGRSHIMNILRALALTMPADTGRSNIDWRR